MAGVVGAAAVAILLVPADESVMRQRGRPSPVASAPVLRLYSSLPKTGIDSKPGLRDIELAVRLAVEEAGPRVGAHQVVYRSLDSGSEDHGIPWEVGKVQGNARAAAGDDRAVAYVGDVFSGATAISMPVLDGAGIPQVTPTSTYAGLTRSEGAEDGEPASYRSGAAANLVRVIPGDHLQAAAQLRWLRSLGVRRLALVSDGEFYGRGIVEMLAARAGRRGPAVVAQGRYDVKRLASIRDLVARIAARKPDAVVFTGAWQSRGAALLGRLNRALPRAWLMGTEGVGDERFLRGLRPGLRRRVLITMPELPVAGLTGEGRAFARSFERRYAHEPDPLAVFGYEAARLTLRAIAQAPAGPVTRVRRAVSAALFATRNRQSVLGRYSIDLNGDTTLGRYGAYRVSAQGERRFVRVLGD